MTKETTIKDKELNGVNGGNKLNDAANSINQDVSNKTSALYKETNSSVRHFQQIVSADVNNDEKEN